MARSKLAADLLDKGGSAAFASLSAAPAARAPGGRHATSLALRPLLAPFKGRGRLFLRIEKLPQQASLSAGHRNSDGSWSLASDELDDLTYLVPPPAARDHALTIRVTALDGGEATTLKVLDFPISFSAATPAAANEPGPDRHGVVSQLAQMQPLLALREAELGLLQARLEEERRDRERETAVMRQGLQDAFDERLHEAAVRHREELEAQRAALQAKIAELTARIPAQSEKDRDAEIIRQHLQKDFDQRLAKATLQHEQELEAERAALQAQITALTARAEGAERRLEEEQQSREAYAAERAALLRQQLEDARRAAVAEGEANLNSARERWEFDLACAVQRAREEWDQEQNRLIETLKAQHERERQDLAAAGREKIALLEAAVAKAVAQKEAPAHDAALDSLKDQLAAARGALAGRERELEEARAQLAQLQAAGSEKGGKDADAEKLLQQERRERQAREKELLEQLSALQSQAEAQITSLTARCREAEGRASRNNWGTAIKDKARIDALTLEVSSLRTALAKQAQAPAQARAESLLNAAYDKASGEPQEEKGSRKTLLRDFCIAVCCITPLILFYPKLMSSVHAFMSDDPPAPLAAAPVKSAAPQAAAKAATATVLRGVNMHKAASGKDDVVMTLKKGATVEILSTAGKWTEVKAVDQHGAAIRGWVYSTYLQATR